MDVPRELEVDLAFALEAVPAASGLFVLDLARETSTHPDARTFGVLLRPFSARSMVDAHYSLLHVSGHGVAGSVLYADVDHPPSPLARARHVVIAPHEREPARARHAARAATTAPEPWQFDALAAALARALRGDSPWHGAVRARLGSGVFEIVPDPFPSPKLVPLRVLLVDDHPSSMEAFRALRAEVDVVHVDDRWEAMTRAASETFDVILCGVVVRTWSGTELYKAVVRARPSLADRFFFLAAKGAVDGAPPSRQAGHVLSRPLDVDTLRELLRRFR